MREIANTTGTPELAGLAERINAEHRACEGAVRSAVDHAINAGEMLAEVKAGLGHGEWLPWLEANFQATPRVAQTYMKLAANKEALNTKRASYSSIRGALAELSAPAEQDGESGGRKEPPASPAAYYVVREQRERVQARIKAMNIFAYEESGLPVVKDGVTCEELVEAYQLGVVLEENAESEKSMLAASVGLTPEQMDERIRRRRNAAANQKDG
jgi:hypothetical protein